MVSEHINRFELFNAMINRTLIKMCGHTGLINGIELEDGGGHNFIVHLLCNGSGEIRKIFVRG